MKLRAPLRISGVAKMLDTPDDPWGYQRTKNWLLALHEKSGGTLLEGGPQEDGGWSPYTVTLAGLYRTCPDAFEPPPGIEGRVEELESDKATDRQQLHQLALVVGALRRERPKMLRVA